LLICFLEKGLIEDDIADWREAESFQGGLGEEGAGIEAEEEK
jgi:hypothetical protein